MIEYQQLLADATDEIPDLRETSYSGCFHDGQEVLSVVKAMHREVLKALRGNDHTVSDMISITEDMLDTAEERPSAAEVRKRCRKTIQRATELMYPETSRLSSSFLKNPGMRSPSQTPPDKPRSSAHTAGLCIRSLSPIASMSSSQLEHDDTIRKGILTPDRHRPNSVISETSTFRPSMIQYSPSTYFKQDRDNSIEQVVRSDSSASRSSRVVPGDQHDTTPTGHVQDRGGGRSTRESIISSHQNEQMNDTELQQDVVRHTNRDTLQANRQGNESMEHSRQHICRTDRQCVHIKQVFKWIEDQKNNRALPPIIPAHYLNELKDRDQVSALLMYLKSS